MQGSMRFVSRSENDNDCMNLGAIENRNNVILYTAISV